MKSLTKKHKTEIANAIIANSNFADALVKYRPIVRKMLLECIDKALAEVTDSAAPRTIRDKIEDDDE
jgi:hypothetical protein